jgi:phosphoenolpyruvate synthase/pyruvate phosphate dikinase
MNCNSKQARLQKAINYAAKIKHDEIFESIQTEIAQQLIAAMLYTLETCEDYEPEDLRRVFNELNGTYDDMRGVGFAGQFDGTDLIDRAKERYGIDIRAEVSVGRHRNKYGGGTG